ncbi:PREDICTED: collagen alpha-1(I) chain-like [Dinoponera quadriceps]|uniref:Collagen alpha-1(I) chain-like n=1 Tax=Dinoponera quadriceps TaxID=609295 RepID=A0A6P3YBJ0_DINQU|nr:PREDICTED: collagen alpha-1(I) chain-like [Dinoponera quadriceps]
MLSDILKCFLQISVMCSFFISSDARATNNAGSSDAFSSASSNAYAGAVASAGTAGASALNGANAFTGAFAGTGSSPGVNERHREIRNYDNINFPHDSDANRGVKSLSHHRGTKSEGHDHNKDGDDCSKCKWENDDYWERDETEEGRDENNEDECDDGDDGQYKPDKTHHHGGNGPRGHTFGPNPPGVHKTGPIYGDDVKGGIKGSKPDGPFKVTNFPVSTGHAGSTGNYGSTPNLGSSWNTPFTSTSKPGYGGVTAHNFVTIPSYGPGTGWNRETTSVSSGSTPKPAWGGGHGDTFGTTPSPIWSTGLGSTPPATGFFSPQKPVGSYGTTPKSGTNWNTVTPGSGFLASQKPETPWNSAHDGTPVGSYGTTLQPEQGWNTGFGSIPTTGYSFSHKPASNWNGDHGNTPVGSFGTTSKPGSSWNTGFGTSRVPSSQNPVPSWNADHGDKPIGSFGTTPKPGSNWKPGYDTSAGTPSTQKPWSTRHDNVFVEISGTTPKPGQNRNIGSDDKPGSSWNPSQGTTSFGSLNCTRPETTCSLGKQGPVKVSPIPLDTAFGKSNEFPGNISPGAPYGGGNTFPLNNPGGPGGNQNRPYGQFETAGTSSVHAGASVKPNFGSTSYSGVPDNFKQKEYPSTSGTITASSWPSSGHIGSGSSTWPGSRTAQPHAGFPVSNIAFGTTKTPFGHVSTPDSSGSPYGGAKPNNFNAASSSAIASANANAFGTSFGTYNTPGAYNIPGTYNTPDITRTTSNHRTPSVSHTGILSYPGIKGPSENIKPTYGIGPYGAQPDVGTGVWPSKLPTAGERETWPEKQPGSGSEARPNTQSSSGNAPWSEKQPENNITPSHLGSGIWPSRQSGRGSTTTPGSHPEIGTSPGRLPIGGSNTWPTQQKGSGFWPGTQVEHGSGSGCKSGSCEGPTIPSSGSKNCRENCNYGSDCSEGDDNVSAIHGPCGEKSGPSGVNKTYYPVGFGDSNIPNISNTYKPNSLPSIGSQVYPEIYNPACETGDNSRNQGDRDVTPGGPDRWNSANPFLHRSVGGIPSDVSRPWSGTTPKSIGKGNLFLDSSQSIPKPGGINANNDRNVIPLNQENTKSFEGNPFLNDNKRRGDIQVNNDEEAISLGGRKTEGNNPFNAVPGSKSNGSNGPSYGGQPAGFPGSGTAGNGDVKSDFYSGEVSSPQSGNIPYPAGSNRQSTSPLQCKLGLFGCGTPGSGSYTATKGGKHPGGIHRGISGNIGAGIGSVNSGPGEPGNSGTGPVSNNYGDGFNIGASHPGSAGNHLAGSGAHVGTYAGSFSSAQASSSSFANAKSFSSSGTGGHGGNFDQTNSGSWSSSGAQNQGRPNSWASSGASAFAGSSAGSGSGNHPVDVKG